MKHYHPQKNDKGQIVELHQPHQPTSLDTWSHSSEVAIATPALAMPPLICGIAVESWRDVPDLACDWEQLAAASTFVEPPFKTAPGKSAASGAVVIESDGRVWVVSPSNRFGGYENTFPKGKLEGKNPLSLRANALKEVYEESGLQVELTGFLCDSDRTTSTTRFYLARRHGGNPADMGWESQAVHLVPQNQLSALVKNSSDKFVLEALKTIGPNN